ncbi:uncharacterized protein BYT42DRAFT_502920 [Radiomyces spectabilis]|uniref:uncharacterized protein n=1 Tax=Radiomyces spectabilis TaxID=64574 RepID=UPI00222127AD|nr:uncharacterized protein BYT42DRAFT_502920 [Radiomyces spectabilis]KAI8369551.1 hypothetical protein BYT42DRAFT_502920 [Radiomyces spectabilis]
MIQLITSVDTLIGYSLAYVFLSKQQHGLGKRNELRLLCRNKEGLEPLEKMGGKIIQVNWQDKKQMQDAFSGVNYVVFVPSNTNQCHNDGENVVKISKEQGVKYMTMMSIIGIDRIQQESRHFQYLNEIAELEKCVQQTFDKDHHCIMRTAMMSQIFYYLAPMVENKNTLCFPIEESRKWCTVDLHDLAEAVYQLSVECPQLSENKAMFQFTSTKTMTCEEMAQTMSRGLEQGPIRYNKITRDELRQYLTKMRDDRRFKDKPKGEEEQRRPGPDTSHTFPLGRYLTECAIEVLLEYFEMVNLGKLDFVTKDLEQVLNRQPQDLHGFFKNNRNQFRRLK